MAKYKNFAELKINDFRAIKSADINLNGITVVSGINGCGKSTMSVLVKDIYESVLDYDKEKQTYINSLMPSNYLNAYNQIIDYGTELLKMEGPSNKVRRIIEEVMSNEFPDYDYDMDVRSLRDLFEEKYLEKRDMLLAQNSNREYPYLTWKMNNLYQEENIFDHVEFSEYGENVVGNGIERIPSPYAVTKVFYTDTPKIIEYNPKDAQKLIDCLKNKSDNFIDRKEARKSIDAFISGTSILNGESHYDKGSWQFLYSTNGKTFRLENCATGVKSFSIIQMLLNNGHLNDKTLLIIDEPEAHLHPQWIVEYAKLIVMLHKELGVKFFLASHNPDFVQSIRYISEKDGVLDSVNFYVAEKENDSDVQYSFKECKDDIEPLFESFNKSFSKFDEYVYPEIFK